MKLAKISLVAAMVLGGLIACSNLASAQDATKDAGKEGKKGKKGMPTIEQQMERMDKQLKFTDEQKPKVKVVLEKYGKQRQELFTDSSVPRDQRREKMQTITDEQNKKMKEILTADQYKKYEEMIQRRGKDGKAGGTQDETKKKKQTE